MLLLLLGGLSLLVLAARAAVWRVGGVGVAVKELLRRLTARPARRRSDCVVACFVLRACASVVWRVKRTNEIGNVCWDAQVCSVRSSGRLMSGVEGTVCETSTASGGSDQRRGGKNKQRSIE